MDEDALLAQALWAAEQAELYEGGGGLSSDAAAGCDSDSDYGQQQRSTKRRKAQQAKKGGWMLAQHRAHSTLRCSRTHAAVKLQSCAPLCC